MKLELWLNMLACVLFLGFAAADLIAFSTMDKQKEITIASRYGRQTGASEILYVNGALVVVAIMLYMKSYRFLPALFAFILFVFLNSRINSGITPGGIFIGSTWLEWNRIEKYHMLNDEISTIQICVYADNKRYVLRCDKEHRENIKDYFSQHDIPME